MAANKRVLYVGEFVLIHFIKVSAIELFKNEEGVKVVNLGKNETRLL